MIMTKCMKNTNDMKEEEGSTAGEITGMKTQTGIGKKKRGADTRKGETEKGGEEAALGSTGEEGPVPEDPEEGDLD